MQVKRSVVFVMVAVIVAAAGFVAAQTTTSLEIKRGTVVSVWGNHLVVKMMGIHHDRVNTGRYEPPDNSVQQWLIRYGKKRLGRAVCIRFQSLAKTGGEDQCFHIAILLMIDTAQIILYDACVKFDSFAIL